MSEKYEVAILSVQAGRSIRRTLSYYLKGKKITRKYIIQGIPVYEGIGYSMNSSNRFEGSLNTWVHAGLTAFTRYQKENGKPQIIHAHGRILNAGA